MRWSIIIWLLWSGNSDAGDKCFCQPAYNNVIYEEDTEVVNVINRHLPLTKGFKAKEKGLDEIVFEKVWKELLTAIPIDSKPPEMRKFQFVKNWPTVPAAQIVRRQTQQIQQATQTQTITAFINQQLIIENGVLTIR